MGHCVCICKNIPLKVESSSAPTEAPMAGETGLESGSVEADTSTSMETVSGWVVFENDLPV